MKDEAIYDELSDLMALTDDEVSLLVALEPTARERARTMSETFYGRLLAHENTAEYLADTSMDARHRLIGDWFVELFGGRYDEDYVRRRLEIGHVHVRIGLPVRYPLAMLDVIVQAGEAVAAESDRPDAARAAFHKVLALDVAVFNQAYEDNQLAHLSTLVGGERLARRLLAGEG